MLKMLRLQDFKSWQDTGDMPFRPITGLFGANSSGKTSILQFLLLMKQTADSPDRKLVLDFGDDQSLVSLGSFRDLVFGHDVALQIRARLDWALSRDLKVADPERPKLTLLSGRDLSFETTISSGGSGTLVSEEFMYGFAGHEFGMRRKPDQEAKYDLVDDPAGFHFARTQGRPWPLPAPAKCYGFPDQVKAYYQNAAFLADLQVALEEYLRSIFYLGPLRVDPERQYLWSGAQPSDVGKRGEQAINALLASRARGELISMGMGIRRRTLEEHVAWWLKRLGLIHAFRVQAIAKGSNLYQVWVQKTARSSEVLITDVGFGVSQILPVLVLCFYVPPGSVVVLEQPEILLHPAVQAGLADVFINAVRTRGIQVVFESHSEHLLQRLQRRIAEGQLLTDDAALYFSEFKGDRSLLTRLDLDLFGNIANWPRDFFGDPLGEATAAAEAALRRRSASS